MRKNTVGGQGEKSNQLDRKKETMANKVNGLYWYNGYIKYQINIMGKTREQAIRSYREEVSKFKSLGIYNFVRISPIIYYQMFDRDVNSRTFNEKITGIDALLEYEKGRFENFINIYTDGEDAWIDYENEVRKLAEELENGKITKTTFINHKKKLYKEFLDAVDDVKEREARNSGRYTVSDTKGNKQ